MLSTLTEVLNRHESIGGMRLPSQGPSPRREPSSQPLNTSSLRQRLNLHCHYKHLTLTYVILVHIYL